MEDSASESVEIVTTDDGQTTLVPADIAFVLKKTARFVAKRGPRSEQYIGVSNAGNPLFCFLNDSDPYHACYQHQLSQFRALNQTTA